MASQPSRNVQLLYDLHEFVTSYFNLDEIRSICFELGINYENLAGDTLSLKARGLIVRLGNPQETGDCPDRYVQLLTILKAERKAFYPGLYEKLEESERAAETRQQILAQRYCDGCAEFTQTTRPLHEKVLSRVGLEQRVGTVTIVVILLGFALGAFLLWRQVRPDSMSGDFNIAVAPFFVVGEAQDIGEDVANSIFGRLQANFADRASPIVDVWGPSEPVLNPVPAVTGDQAAMELANEINADIVVYGIVTKNNRSWQVTPKFYISPKNFEDAAEILGPYDLGEPFGLSEGSPRALRITSGDELSPRAEFLTQVAVGLTYYSITNYDRAAETFMDILSSEAEGGPVDDETLRLVYLLLGNTFLKKALQEISAENRDTPESIATSESIVTQFLKEARTNFEASSEIDPEYGRAFLGLGSIAFQQSFICDVSGCENDGELMQQAIAFYEEALTDKTAPETAVLEAKAYFGIGQTYLQQYFDRGDFTFTDAISYFQKAIANYGAGNRPRARDIAAESSARLGLIYCLQGTYDEAAIHYQNAIDLFSDQPRQEASRLLSVDVRKQRIELFEYRLSQMEDTENARCTGSPP